MGLRNRGVLLPCSEVGKWNYIKIEFFVNSNYIHYNSCCYICKVTDIQLHNRLIFYRVTVLSIIIAQLKEIIILNDSNRKQRCLCYY